LKFSGDQPDRTHQILWNKEGYLSSKGLTIPPPSERVPLVIVGGGMSGLLSAYLLKQHRPIVLERADRMGGNSRGESWNGIDYSIGAAYFMEPEAGSPLKKLLSDIGIEEGVYRLKKTEDPIGLNGKRYQGFWDGVTAPAHAAQFRKINRYFRDVFDGTNGALFPDIPITDLSTRSAIEALDRVSFKKHMEKIAGGKLHSHIETALEHFCWSSFNASFSEVSAASGLNFYAGEFGNVCVTPGGNAAIAEHALDHAMRVIPKENFRVNSIVFDVQVVTDGVHVTYEDQEGRLRTIHSRSVIMACPKFAAAKIIQDLEPARTSAIRKLQYNSYLVANVLVNQPIPDTFYDLFLLGRGKVDSKDIRKSSNSQGVTDVVLGTFARMNSKQTVLTLYRGMPYSGARGVLLSPHAYDLYRKEFEHQLDSEILPLLGLSSKNVVDLRMTRWGHPLPVAATGLIADGTIDTIRAPFRERVFFIEQDNWMLPAFETAALEALHFSTKIASFLG